jgi:nucleoside-diphosphate-sugar epimerase
MDLLDSARVREVVHGYDAVVHLAAIPNPYADPPDRVMGVNTVSTLNLLEAMRANGVPRLVYGCSESASGFGIHNVAYRPEYLPIDEQHPSWPHEPYSLSKYFGEVLCQEYSRAYGLEAVSLRYGWVWFDWEKEQRRPALARREIGDWFNAYVFAQDVAQAFRLALAYKLDQSPAFATFYILAADAFAGIDSRKTIRALYPSAPPRVDEEYFRRDPNASFFTCAKAREKLGYRPLRSWREWLAG